MARNSMSIKAHEENVFAKGFGEYIRTIPTRGPKAPYIGYIKTTLGESEVSYNSKVVFEVLTSGEEITEEEYNNAELTVINDL